MTREAVIVAACRTPVGRAVKGTTRDVRPDEMAAAVIGELLRRTQGKLDPAEIDDVILGCAFPEGDQGLNMARPVSLRAGLPALVGRRVGRFSVLTAEDFAYTDPVDGTVSAHQGIRIEFAEGARVVYRLSGTGTEGATLRVYLERFEPDPARHAVMPDAALAPLAATAAALADIGGILGRSRPSVVA